MTYVTAIYILYVTMHSFTVRTQSNIRVIINLLWLEGTESKLFNHTTMVTLVGLKQPLPYHMQAICYVMQLETCQLNILPILGEGRFLLVGAILALYN